MTTARQRKIRLLRPGPKSSAGEQGARLAAASMSRQWSPELRFITAT